MTSRFVGAAATPSSDWRTSCCHLDALRVSCRRTSCRQALAAREFSGSNMSADDAATGSSVDGEEGRVLVPTASLHAMETGPWGNCAAEETVQ